MTFPWGSIVLFGIDKVTKYHMDVPLHTTTFQWLMNKDLCVHVAGAKEGHRRSLHDRMGGEVRRPVGRLRTRRAATRSRPMPGHEVYKHHREQLTEWKKTAEPLQTKWADNVRDGGRRSRRDHERTEGGAGQVQRGLLMQSASPRRASADAAASDHARCCAAAAPRSADGLVHRLHRARSLRPSSASSRPTSSSRSCCAISSACKFRTPTISAGCCSAS